MTRGICRNLDCTNGKAARPVERYPGPGEFCPECGFELEALPAAAQPAAPKPAAPRRRRGAKPYVFASIAVALAVGGGFAAFRPVAVGRPSADGLHVCRSSISERLSTDVVAAYRASTPDRAAQDVSFLAGDCDVRFSVVAGAPPPTATVIAHDALVAVVHPDNPLGRLTLGELRGILAGELTDWAQLGRGHGRIAVVVPDGTTDEGRLLVTEILRGDRLATSVRRVGSTAEVVALVAGAHGRNVLGIASFSGAVPAKVLHVGSAPPPNPLTIAEHRYPLALAIAVQTDGIAPPPEATTLVRYARSEEAQAIAARDGLVPLKGY